MVEGPEAAKTEDIPIAKNEVSKKRTKEEKQQTKVVIRKLPANMAENSFLDFISPLFEHDYFYYVKDENPTFGDQSYSRAYINFVNIDDVYTFTVKFDDYVFIDETGQEYPAVVEYAPFQRIPKNRSGRRSDSLCGTIEEDSDYQEFVQKLEAEARDKSSQITEHYFDLANDENEEKVTTTPLIEFLTSRKNEYIKYKEEKKEERRRRDIERKKMKEESRRIKKEKETFKAKSIEKSKDEKKANQNDKISDEVTSSSSRIRGKSYQEERQRDLARRKLEEKPSKTDDNKENNKNALSDEPANEDEKSADDSDAVKSKTRATHKDEEFYKKNQSDKKSLRDEDRKSSYHSREKEEKKYSYGVKKREFVGGYDYDSKYSKGSRSSGYYYEDYKSKGHSSHQKNSYVSSKYGKGKDYYEEKVSKHHDSKSRKHEYSEYNDQKSSRQVDKKQAADKSLQHEANVDKTVKKTDRKTSETSNSSKLEGISRSSSKETENHSGSTSEIESSKSKDARKEKSENDPRAERRIKNKDRPTLEIYRPGMGKFSRQRLERNKSNDSKDCD